MSNDQLENVYQLLTEHNFDTNKKISDEFKCGKCRKILIKACQTRCGCRFCRSCVDEMMNNGCQFCPGITNNCRNGLLSTVVIDYRANNQILDLKLKCPQEMCLYECDLLEMSEHLRICGKKSEECPFYKLGCDMKKMSNEKMVEHLHFENYNHTKTLIDMIDIIKNEVEELREKELKNRGEINKLKTDLQSKDEKIKSINTEIEGMKIEKLEMENRLKNVEENFNIEMSKLKSKHEKEIQLIKTEKEELDSQMRIGLRNVWYKFDKIDAEWKKKYESIKSELMKKIGILQTNFDNKIDKIEPTTTESQSINDEEIRWVCKETIDKSIMQMEICQKINQLEINVDNKMKGIFEWLIDKVDEFRNKSVICSDYFYARMHPYKLRLLIDPKYSEKLRVCLCIYDDVENHFLSFPFKADVTIKIINKYKREVSKTITKYCEILKPENNSTRSSSKFIFSKSDLIESGVLESNCFLVQCCVVLR